MPLAVQMEHLFIKSSPRTEENRLAWVLGQELLQFCNHGIKKISTVDISLLNGGQIKAEFSQGGMYNRPYKGLEFSFNLKSRVAKDRSDLNDLHFISWE